MNYKIIAASKFSKNIKQLKKKYKNIKKDFDACIELLEKNPFSGTSLGSGLYKLRLKSSDIPKGKAVGARPGLCVRPGCGLKLELPPDGPRYCTIISTML